ncbi:MAG: DUF4827 domain-containing protein [Dysgonamonadaceae bacterium]|jgi:hypothetical protein|nr:DUF4827 domain-containing protein [Dysgonamonadaceae bacterium]
MKKGILFILSLIAVIIFISSCNDQKTAQELIQEEKKAIERFIARNGIRTLSSYPKDGVFAENEYYRNPDGLYIHVVDSGNGRRVVVSDEIQVRFDEMQYFKSDTSSVSSDLISIDPFAFLYGNPYSYDNYGGYYTCIGWVIPLSYVGEGAIVNLIIPSNLGASGDQNAYRPVFYKGLRYTSFF